MKKLVYILLAIASFTLIDSSNNELKAQQDAQYSMYMFNGLAINPAYAGSRERWAITALYRHQWAGFGDGIPRTATANAHGTLLDDRMGLGISFSSDRIGPTDMISVAGSYAYRIPIGSKKERLKGHLAVGLSAQFTNYTQRWDEINTTDQGDQSFASGTVNIFAPNFGAGLYYSNDIFYIGASIPNILNANLDERVKYESEGNDVARKYRHYFATAGVMIKLTDNVKMKPSLLYKIVQDAPVSGDYNLSFLFKEALWIGASYRTSFKEPVAVLGMVEYMFAKHLRIGYAYDYTLSDIGAYQSGTHEIMMSYEFGNNDKYLTPRRMSYF